MRRNYPIKQKSNKSRYIVILLGMVTLIGSLGGMAFYQYKYHSMNAATITNYVTRVRTWFGEHKIQLHQHIQQVKQFASQDEAEPPIHFEFYKTLSSTQAETTNPIIADAPPIASKAKHDAERNSNAAHSALVDSDALAKSIVTNEPIVNAAELEQQLSQQVSEDNYIVQAGVFHTASGAEQFKKSLMAAGFKAKVVKATNADKEIYRVQIGPYTNKSQAQLAERQLQKKGITGIVRKI